MGGSWLKQAGSRLLASVLAGLAIAGSVAIAEPGNVASASPEVPRWVEELADVDSVQRPGFEAADPAEPEVSEPSEPLAESEFPDPASWDVSLDSAEPVSESGLPVAVLPADGASATGEELTVEVLDQGAAAAAGASGFVFTIGSATGGSSSDVARSAAGSAAEAPVVETPAVPVAQWVPADAVISNVCYTLDTVGG